MGCAVTVYISSPIMSRVAPLVDSGEFETLSEVCRYSLRLYMEWLEAEDIVSVDHILRASPVKHNMKLNEFVVDRILARRILNMSEMMDYALSHYLAVRGL